MFWFGTSYSLCNVDVNKNVVVVVVVVGNVLCISI